MSTAQENHNTITFRLSSACPSLTSSSQQVHGSSHTFCNHQSYPKMRMTASQHRHHHFFPVVLFESVRRLGDRVVTVIDRGYTAENMKLPSVQVYRAAAISAVIIPGPGGCARRYIPVSFCCRMAISKVSLFTTSPTRWDTRDSTIPKLYRVQQDDTYRIRLHRRVASPAPNPRQLVHPRDSGGGKYTRRSVTDSRRPPSWHPVLIEISAGRGSQPER
ncbi:hypothetical protein QBC39DRAFT_44823 [Podospora conica]|nr:hypothetical protein QBC39DRAFT_44823 [Schizothecium conicum]